MPKFGSRSRKRLKGVDPKLVEVLEENYAVIADSGIFTMKIEESNKAEQEEYDQDQYHEIY